MAARGIIRAEHWQVIRQSMMMVPVVISQDQISGVQPRCIRKDTSIFDSVNRPPEANKTDGTVGDPELYKASYRCSVYQQGGRRCVENKVHIAILMYLIIVTMQSHNKRLL